MGERVVSDQAAGGGEGPPVAQVLPGSLLDEEGRHRHVGPAHDGQHLRAGGPAVVDGDVDGPPAGLAKQYSRSTAGLRAWGRAGIVTGTDACSPSWAVRGSRGRQGGPPS